VQQPRLAPGVQTGGGGGGGGGGIAPNAAPIAVWLFTTLLRLNVQEVLAPHALAAPVQPEN
jgi:hypothetical protein